MIVGCAIFRHRHTAYLVDTMYRRAKAQLDEDEVFASGVSLDLLKALVVGALADEGVAWRPSLLAQWPRVEAQLRVDDLVFVYRREDPARRVEETFLRSRSPKARRAAAHHGLAYAAAAAAAAAPTSPPPPFVQGSAAAYASD